MTISKPLLAIILGCAVLAALIRLLGGEIVNQALLATLFAVFAYAIWRTRWWRHPASPGLFRIQAGAGGAIFGWTLSNFAAGFSA